MDISVWLKGLGLGQYAATFAEHGVDGERLPGLTDADLQAMGLRRLGDRSKLLRAIAAMEASPDTGGAVAADGMISLVGREQEMERLLGCWRRACGGAGQVAHLVGEAGIGKSRLTQNFRQRAADRPHTVLSVYCSPQYRNSALHPVIRELRRAAKLQRGESPVESPVESPDRQHDLLEAFLHRSGVDVSKLAPILAELLSIPSEQRYRPLALGPGGKKETLEALTELLVGIAARQPLLLIVEDVQWLDPTSRALLERIIERQRNASVLSLLTYRSELAMPWIVDAPHITTLNLGRLSQPESAEMIGHLTGGKDLPQEVLEQIVAKTEGVPLFIEHVSKAILAEGFLKDEGDRYALTGPLPTLAVPITLQDSIMRRLDGLGPAKTALQIGAVVGRRFSFELLSAVAGLDVDNLKVALVRLTEAGLIDRLGESAAGAGYAFRHALVQETAYNGLQFELRRQLHARIVDAMHQRFHHLAAAEPEVLAHHCDHAGQNEQAIGYWQQAGQNAIRHSANAEAIWHLNNALRLLKGVPDSTDRAHRELELQTLLGPAQMAIKGQGSAEVERTYLRARDLCERVGDKQQLFSVSRGLWVFYHLRARYDLARRTGERLLALADDARSTAYRLEANRALGMTWLYLGEFSAARNHLEQGSALYDPKRHGAHAYSYGTDPGVACLSFGAYVLCFLGYPDQAGERSRQGLTLAQQSSHPFSIAQAMNFVSYVHLLRREVEATHESAELMCELADEHGFAHWSAVGQVLLGWSLAWQGQNDDGITLLREGLAAYQATGAERAQSYFLALLAEAYAEHGLIEDGLNTVADALVEVAKSGERYYEAELYRLKGLLHWRRNDAASMSEAEACFSQSLVIARRQGAKSWQLRTATSLARLWRAQDKRERAHQVLKRAYCELTEGRQTADLQEAEALLAELA